MKLEPVFIAASIFFGGYLLGHSVVKVELQRTVTQYERNARQAAEQYRVETEKLNDKLSQALADLSVAQLNRSYVRVRLDRVRQHADALRGKLSKANAGPCQSERKTIARCTELLEEGAELLNKGSKVSQDIATRNDTLIRLTK